MKTIARTRTVRVAVADVPFSGETAKVALEKVRATRGVKEALNLLGRWPSPKGSS